MQHTEYKLQHKSN